MTAHCRIGRITYKGSNIKMLPLDREPDKDAVEHLETALAKIKNGEYQGCAVILTNSRGDISTAYSKTWNEDLVYGTLQLLWRLMP